MSVGKCDCGNIYIYIYRRSTGSTRTHMHMYIIMGIHLDYLIWLYVQLYFHIVMLLKMATAYSLHRYVMTKARCSHQAPVLLRRRIATQPAASRLVGAGINCQGRVCQVCWETSLPGNSYDNPRVMPDMDQEGYTGPCFYNTYFIGHGFGLIAKT